MSVQPRYSDHKPVEGSSSLINEYGERVSVSISMIKSQPQVCGADSGDLEDVQCLDGFQIRANPDEGWVERITLEEALDNMPKKRKNQA